MKRIVTRVTKKSMCIVSLMLIGIILTTAVVYATTISYSYNGVSTSYQALHISSPKKNGTLKVNTEIYSGENGAKIMIAGTDGTTHIESFPYHVPRSDMQVSVKKNKIYTTSIKAISGTITGVATIKENF